jgi:hypothetical protein
MTKTTLERVLRRARQQQRTTLIIRCKRRLGVTPCYGNSTLERWAQTMWS